MPRETINIENFHRGIISKVDSGDIPDESCPYCKNINPLFTEGKLQPIAQTTTLLNAGQPLYGTYAAKISAFIDEDATQKTLLFHDGTTLRAIEDFHNATPVVYGSPIAMNGYSITPYNNFANIGNGDADPKWAGYIKNLQFDGLKAFTGTGIDDLVVDLSNKASTTAKTINVEIIAATIADVSSLSWGESGGYISVTEASTTRLVGDLITFEALYDEDYEQGGIWYTAEDQLIFGTARVTSVTTNSFDIDYPYPSGYITPVSSSFNYTVSTTSSSNTFKVWCSTDEAEPADGTAVVIVANKQYNAYVTVSNGVKISFGNALGHIAGDAWTITLKASPVNTLAIVDAELKNYKSDNVVALSVAFSEAGTTFLKSAKYYYGWSFIYDNVQESSIAWKEDSIWQPTGDYSKATVTLSLTYTSLSARITGINIYRADSSLIGFQPESLFRLVKSIDLNGNFTYSSGTVNLCRIIDSGDLQASYEAITGVPQTIDSTIVRYTYGTIVNNKFIMAKCYTDYWNDSLRLIFASKPNQFNIVDVTSDVARVKFIPTSITSYNGKILVFGDNQYAIINPEGMYIEYETAGIGCYSHKSIYTTDWGVYWMDTRVAYYYNGSNTEIISDNISEKVISTLKSWSDLFGANIELQTIYYHQMRSILFINLYTGIIWCYYLPYKSWFYWEIGATNATKASLFIDKDNILYLSRDAGAGAAWYSMFTSTTYFAWEWYSKKLNLGDPGQYKKFYEIKGDGNATITYGIDDAALTSALTSDMVASADWKARRLQIKAAGTQSSTLYYLNSIAIIFRRLIGKR